MAYIKDVKSYTRHYQGFKGVDFSSDHTLCNKARFPYLQNMYKDYSSSYGQAVETVAGFEQIFDFSVFRVDGDEVLPKTVWSVIPFSYTNLLMEKVNVLFIHVGERLYRWQDYPNKGEDNANITLTPIAMKNGKSSYFVFNNHCYVLDGKNYLKTDGVTVSAVVGYVPTTYVNIVPDGANAGRGTQLEQQNLLSPSFKNTFVITDTALTYTLSCDNLATVDSVVAYGTPLQDYTVDTAAGTVTFAAPLTTPISAGYSEGYAGLEITATRAVSGRLLIEGCTLSAVYDNAVFFSGNPATPNVLYYSAVRNAEYVGQYNFVSDGQDLTGIGALVASGSYLIALKGDTRQDSSVYYHYPQATDYTVHPREYPSKSGLYGLGVLGEAINFLDDVVFISRLGLEALGQSDLKSERHLEHRSALADGKLLQEQLADCRLAEWNGYLLCLVNGKIYMADSRQRTENAMGQYEYEWYYLTDIGVYEGQYQAYAYATELPSYLLGSAVTIAPASRQSQYANQPNEQGIASNSVTEHTLVTDGQTVTYYTVTDSYEDLSGNVVSASYLVTPCQNQIGGVFKKATSILSANGNVLFGTENGALCAFFFDKRSGGEIPTRYYHFNGRIIYSGCATAFDNCDVPNYVKSTVKNSLVIKCKTLPQSNYKVKVRTDSDGFSPVGEVNNGRFNFEDLSFEDLTFNTQEQQLYVLRESKKNWVEKQLLLYSDVYLRPFALYFITYEYRIMRRAKNTV